MELEATNAARAAGISNAAVIEDVVTLAASRFKFDTASGKVLRVDESGNKLYRGNDLITVSDWLQSQRTEKPHLFRDAGQSPSGPGASNNSGSSGSNYSDDPAEYRRQREREMAAAQREPQRTDAATRERNDNARAFANFNQQQGGQFQQSRYSDDPQEYQRQRRAEMATANSKR